MTIRESFENGFDAALAGKPRENLNPWNASLHCAWLRGWDAGNQHRNGGLK
jgi:ribosome modulation factor